MIFLSNQELNYMSPFSNWQARNLLDKPMGKYCEERLNEFSDEFYCLEGVWLSQESCKQLREKKTIITDDKVLAAPYNFLDEDVTGETYKSTDSFLISYPWHLISINTQIVEEKIIENKILGDFSSSANNDGILHLGEGSRILPGVYIEGKVSIGKNCKIGPNCYLRGSTSIGDGCHIGQSVEIKNSFIMNNSNVGHLSYVGDSILGNCVNLGAGTITANLRHDNNNHKVKINNLRFDTKRRKLGVVLGDNVHTGINTSFYPACIMGEGTTTKPSEVVLRGKNL